MNKNNYKGSDFLSDANKDVLEREVNPFGYNFLGVSKNEVNGDLLAMKSTMHNVRKVSKK